MTIHTRSTVLAALVLTLAAASCGGIEGDDSPRAKAADPSELMLRLTDLTRGYRRGDDSGCFGEMASLEGASAHLNEVLNKTRPRGCVSEFNRVWGRPGTPVAVGSAALVFRDADGARQIAELRDDLVPRILAVRVGRAEATDGPGEEATVFDSPGLNHPGAGVMWRDGRVLAVVYQEGLGGEEGRAHALELADKQQRHIESPTQTETVSDAELALDDPALAVPVYWLGERYAPGRGLPPLELADAANLGSSGPGSGPGNDVKIDYRADGGGVTLDLWRPAAWRRVRKTRFGRLVWASPCARRSELALDEGRAVIYGGYSLDTPPCPRRDKPDHWLAHVELPDVVLVVNMPYCYTCAGRSRTDPYNTRAGMEAVVRGLRRR